MVYSPQKLVELLCEWARKIVISTELSIVDSVAPELFRCNRSVTKTRFIAAEHPRSRKSAWSVEEKEKISEAIDLSIRFARSKTRYRKWLAYPVNARADPLQNLLFAFGDTKTISGNFTRSNKLGHRILGRSSLLLAILGNTRGSKTKLLDYTSRCLPRLQETLLISLVPEFQTSYPTSLGTLGLG